MTPQPRSSQASAPRRSAPTAAPQAAARAAFSGFSSLRLVSPVLVSGLIGILIILPL